MVRLLEWTLLLPFLGSLSLFRMAAPRVPRASWPGRFATVVVFLALLLSTWAVLTLPKDGFHINAGEWIPGFGAAWSLQLDWLSSWLLLLVDFIGLMVHLFSLAYMREERDQQRYFCALLFFIAMMKLLILSGSYLLLFAGWEGVGLASYLLIGFHFERPLAAKAATKAFLVNRFADAGFLLGIIALVVTCGSTNYAQVAMAAPHLAHSTIVLVCSLLVVGAAGKSAQFPLHVWLPDAMEGPTPVSALIHSATMVCAGIYLLARSSFLLDLAPEVGLGVSALGALTALFAATVALVENDIKRVLAYSTISQIGFMFIALGIRADRAAMFHVITHACFKALLFLGAGSVIHALHGEQNLKRMGGLRTKMPVTFWTMCAGALTLAGLPGLSGFFSKDFILEATLASSHQTLWFIGVLTSVLTACYAWRMIALVFLGSPRTHRIEPHEAPFAMRIPLVILGVGCLIIGWAIVPIHWSAWPTMITSTVAAALGIALASQLYLFHPERRAALDERFRTAVNVLRNRWFIDAVYEVRILDGLVLRTAAGAALVDAFVIDATVNGASSAYTTMSHGGRWFDRFVIDAAVRFVAGVSRFLSWPMRALQGGLVQSYALLFIGGVIAILGYYLTR